MPPWKVGNLVALGVAAFSLSFLRCLSRSSSVSASCTVSFPAPAPGASVEGWVSESLTRDASRLLYFIFDESIIPADAGLCHHALMELLFNVAQERF